MNGVKRIWVAGHRGMVGSAIVRELSSSGLEVLTVDRSLVDLRDQKAVELWLKWNKPDAIIFAAAKVGLVAGMLDIARVDGSIGAMRLGLDLVLGRDAQLVAAADQTGHALKPCRGRCG